MVPGTYYVPDIVKYTILTEIISVFVCFLSAITHSKTLIEYVPTCAR